MTKTIEILEKKIIDTTLLYPRLRKAQVDSRFNKEYWTVKGTVDDSFVQLLAKHQIKSKVKPTGDHDLTFEFKANAADFKGRTGDLVKRKPPVVVDSKNNPLEDSVVNNIGNGTTAKLAFNIMKHTATGTVYIQLVGVQILDLVEYNGQGNIFTEADGFIAELDEDVSDDNVFNQQVSADDLSKI